MEAVPACATNPALFHGVGRQRAARQGAGGRAPIQGRAARAASSDATDRADAWSDWSHASAASTLMATTASTQTARRRAKRMMFRGSGWNAKGRIRRDCPESGRGAPLLNRPPTFLCTRTALPATPTGRKSQAAQRRESGHGKGRAHSRPKNSSHRAARAFARRQRGTECGVESCPERDTESRACVRAQVRPPEGDGKARPAARHRPGAAPAAAL